jgi:hypothetical protein
MRHRFQAKWNRIRLLLAPARPGCPPRCFCLNAAFDVALWTKPRPPSATSRAQVVNGVRTSHSQELLCDGYSGFGD